jgi:hypothetical protein
VGITPSTNSTAFEVRDTVNNIATLPAITCSILPDYTLTGATPAAGSGTLVVDSGATFTVHKTFAMPTDDGQNNYVLKTNGAGVGSWAVDSAGTGTVQSVSVTTANGVSGTVAASTTTPAITIALGAITPTSSTVSGNVSVGGDLIATSLKSTAGNQTLLLSPIASSVNYVAIEPSVTGSAVHIYAQGADGSIGLHLSPKGTGYVNIQDGADESKRIRFGASGNGTGMITTIESASTASQTITLPNATTTLAGLAVAQTFSAANAFSAITTVSNATTSTSTGNGALVVTGGLGVGGNAYIGGVINIPATTATAGQITQAGERFIHTYTPGVQNQNVFIGFQSGRTSTMTGGGNVGIGRAVLQGLTSGANNLCFGDGTAYQLSSGSSNVFIGQASGGQATSAAQNTACGVGALKNVATTSSNAGFGYGALEFNTGSNSVGVGFNSGNLSTSSNGVYLGHNAGNVTVTVGGLAGVAITSAANCTMLGQGSGSTSATGDYRTAIGSDSRCNAANALKLGRDTLDRVIFPSWTADPASDLVVGMVIFRSDTSTLKVYTSTGWKTITAI